MFQERRCVPLPLAVDIPKQVYIYHTFIEQAYSTWAKFSHNLKLRYAQWSYLDTTYLEVGYLGIIPTLWRPIATSEFLMFDLCRAWAFCAPVKDPTPRSTCQLRQICQEHKCCSTIESLLFWESTFEATFFRGHLDTQNPFQKGKRPKIMRYNENKNSNEHTPTP